MKYLIFAILLIFATPAWATCTAPAGVEGEIIYNSDHKVLQYCDGKDWWGMGSKLSFGGMDSNKINPISQYVSEFSGYVSSTDCSPATDKIVTIGTIAATTATTSFHTFVEVIVYTSHRGYNNTNYFGYKHWVVTAGENVSSALIDSAGTDASVDLWDGTTAGTYNTVPLTSDFDIKLRFSPKCGASRQSYYVVKFKEGGKFTPHSVRSW